MSSSKIPRAMHDLLSPEECFVSIHPLVYEGKDVLAFTKWIGFTDLGRVFILTMRTDTPGNQIAFAITESEVTIGQPS